ncbi:MAG: uracil-DNA glycosylase, partial [Gemmatimonadetes bacterium]
APTPGAPAPRPPAAAARPGASSEVALPHGSPPDLGGLDLEGVRAVAEVCTACGLAETRTHVVFSDGAPDARVMVVGEAPGANEDRTGLPFVGQAGKLLDLLLATVGLSRRESVYICNVLKCRPPGNRDPQPDEIAACVGFLKRQIELVRPEAILAVGTFAARALTGRANTALGKLRGTVHAYEGVPLVVTYHPAALLRNGGWTRATWDDLQLLRSVLDRSAGGEPAP